MITPSRGTTRRDRRASTAAPLVLLCHLLCRRTSASSPSPLAYVGPRIPTDRLQRPPRQPTPDGNPLLDRSAVPSSAWSGAVRFPDPGDGGGDDDELCMLLSERIVAGFVPLPASDPACAAPLNPRSGPPEFCVGFHREGMEGSESRDPCLSLRCLGDGRRYHDTTFRLRWKFPPSRDGSIDHTSSSVIGDSSGVEFNGIEWRGGKRFLGGDSPKGDDSFVCNIPSAEVEQLRRVLLRNDDDEEGKAFVDLEAEIVVHGSGSVVRNGAGGTTPESDGEGGGTDPKFWQSWRGYRMVAEDEEEPWLKTGLRAALFKDVRAENQPPRQRDDRPRIGSVVIPLLSTQAEGILPEPIERPLRVLFSTLFSATVLGGSWVNVPTLFMKNHRSMWEKGVYPGVEYTITRIVDPSDDDGEDPPGDQAEDLFYHRPGADYELTPIYRLGGMLDRRWPVRINEAEIPNLISPLQYNIATAVGALTASATILTSAFTLSLLTSLFFIPSRSMEPTLKVGDVLLVEKVSPRLPFASYKPGDVVLFHPPSALSDLVEKNGGRLSSRDLFVKRVAAVAGDIVEVRLDGGVKVSSMYEDRETPVRNLCGGEPLGLIKKYVKPGVTTVPKGRVLLLGDCSSVSVDGRVWGTLDTNDIVGRPIVRTWPPSKMGGIPDLPTVGNRWSN